MEDNFDFDPDEEIVFDEREQAFLDMLSEYERSTTFLVNPDEVKRMKRAYALILQALKESGCKAKVGYGSLETARDVGCIVVEAPEIQFKEKGISLFAEAASLATNTEAFPLVNGNVQLTLGFNHLMIPVD